MINLPEVEQKMNRHEMVVALIENERLTRGQRQFTELLRTALLSHGSNFRENLSR